jgi:hypothetical protein
VSRTDNGRPPTLRRANLVEETQDGDQLAVVAGDRHVEADDRRLGALGTQAPGEAGLLMVLIDRAGQGEHEARELGLRGGDGRVDGVPAVRLGQRVDVTGVGSPGAVDQLAAGRRVGLVPAVELLSYQVVHRECLSWLIRRCGRAHPADRSAAVSITREVMRGHYLGGNRGPAGGRLASGSW